MSHRISGALVFSVLSCIGCHGETDGYQAPDSATSCRGVTSVLSVKDRMGQSVSIFNVGEQIRFEISVTNNSTLPITLSPSWTCATALFVTKDSNGQEVERSDDFFCFAAHPPQTYASFETLTHFHTVSTLSPGEFSVDAIGGQFSNLYSSSPDSCQIAALHRRQAFVVR